MYIHIYIYIYICSIVYHIMVCYSQYLKLHYILYYRPPVARRRVSAGAPGRRAPSPPGASSACSRMRSSYDD